MAGNRWLVSREMLLLIAGLLWSVAGYKVMRTGMLAWQEDMYPLLWKVACAIAVFLLFGGVIFRSLYHKYTRRIAKMPHRNHPLNFFDKRGWAVMSGMIALGVVLRNASWVSPFFIAFFYTGLGTALLLTGLRFLYFLYTFGPKNRKG